MMEGKCFRERWEKKLAAAARKGRRIGVMAVAGAIAFSSVSYVKAAGVEDVFDERYYADRYPDLKAAYGYDRAALLEHFMSLGISEGRAMNGMIDIVKYRETYGDLQAVFGDDWDAYVTHYLTCGAFEHRDSGTGFDPVDYLNRYGELNEAFGGDILAAYRHYEEYGKQEGREGRSEAEVKAEEARRKAEEEARRRAEEEARREEEREETPGAGEQETEKPSEDSVKPETFQIQDVEVRGSGRIRVTLNRKTEQPLALEAFNIICNRGGSDMTILSVSTADQKVYDLTTAYYKDQEYDLQISLADGTAVSKTFSYRMDCAQIAGINAVRTGVGEAVISYNSDEPGAFYYLLRENGLVQTGRASLVELVETVEAAEPTEAEIMKDGVRADMVQHENTVTVTGLKEGMSYKVYYVAVNTENKTTLVNSLVIEGKVFEETAGAIKRAEAFAEKQGNGEFLYGFEIELNTASSEPLALGQFDISCPLGKTALGQVKTSDNKTYRVYMERGSIPKEYNTYTILINMKDGTQLKKTCYLDLQAPRVSVWKIEWTDQDTVNVIVNSDEAGMLYYAVQDEVEGEGTVAAKDPAQIYASGVKYDGMGYGLNYITVKGVRAGQWFCYASEDARGNREDFYSYKRIPEYSAPVETKGPAITGVTVVRASGGAQLKVTFNQAMFGLYDNTKTQISGVDKKLLIAAEYGSGDGLQDNVLTLSIQDPSISIPAGSHTLTVILYDGTTLTFNFTV